MSISKSRRRPRPAGAGGTRGGDRDTFDLPATVSRPALLDRGSDKRFRALVYDLLTISTRMDVVREHLARRMKLTGPQYSVLMAIGQFQGRGGVGVGVGSVARLLHVSSAFIATETGKLAQAGFVSKRPNPKDRRGVLLSLTRTARSLIEDNSAEIRAVNDTFFGPLNRAAFEAVSAAAGLLVQSSRKATHRVRMLDDEAAGVFREAAE